MEVKEIQSTWGHNGHTNKNSYYLKGQILVYENGWCEGYAKQTNGINMNGETGFLFGFCHLEFIQLFYCIGDLVYRFHRDVNGEQYIGQYSLAGESKEKILGPCYIAVKDNAAKEQENAVRYRSEIAKKTSINQTGKNFYEQLIAKREELTFENADSVTLGQKHK